MCITFPGLVIAIDAADAIVELDGRRRRASTLLQPTVDVGDWVLIGAGTVLRRLEPAEALDLARTFATARSATETRAAALTPGGPR